MKYVLMTMMLVFGLVLPGSAGEREDALINGLLGLGARALQAAETQQAPQTTQSSMAPAPATAVPSFAQMVAAPIKQTLDELVEQYKVQYKEEGRAYAREVGDIVVSRVVKDPEINSTISSLRTLCWAVVAYLTLVTLIMLACLVYLRQANARLLAEVRRLARQHSN